MSTTIHGDLAAYTAFLEGKADFHHTYGRPVAADEVNPILKDHQRAIVQWAVEGGRRAIFASFGLGKTLMQLEVLRLTLNGTGRALIVLPLGVRQEFTHDAAMLGIPVRFDAKGALPATFMSLAPGSWSEFVWHDVNRMLTLNGEQSQRAQAMHVCPLQFDIVDRLIERFSNPGELVYDPFGGLSTVALRALKLGRRGRTSELNPDYWRDGVAYLRAEERAQGVPSLFDLDPVA